MNKKEWDAADDELAVLFHTDSVDIKRMTDLLMEMDKHGRITQSNAAQYDVHKFMLISELCLLLEDLETEEEKNAAIAGFKVGLIYE